MNEVLSSLLERHGVRDVSSTALVWSQSQGVKWIMSVVGPLGSHCCVCGALVHLRFAPDTKNERLPSRGSHINLGFVRIILRYPQNRVRSTTWMVLLLLGVPASHGSLRQLKLVNEWKSVDFIFPSEHQKNDAILRQEYIPGMAVPIDVDVYYKGSSFSITSSPFFNYLSIQQKSVRRQEYSLRLRVSGTEFQLRWALDRHTRQRTARSWLNHTRTIHGIRIRRKAAATKLCRCSESR